MKSKKGQGLYRVEVLRTLTEADMAELKRAVAETERALDLGRKMIAARKTPRGARRPFLDAYIEAQLRKNPRITNVMLWNDLVAQKNPRLQIDAEKGLIEMREDGTQRGAPLSFEGFAKRANKLKRARSPISN
jgi:hypothetical protein